MSKVSSHDFSTQTHTFASGAVRVARENRTYRIFLIPATYGILSQYTKSNVKVYTKKSLPRAMPRSMDETMCEQNDYPARLYRTPGCSRLQFPARCGQ